MADDHTHVDDDEQREARTGEYIENEEQPDEKEKEDEEKDDRHRVTIDQFVASVIKRAWLKHIEIRNLDYTKFREGDEPQQVFVTVTLQDPNDPEDELELDSSGSYIGEALQMMLDQIDPVFPAK